MYFPSHVNYTASQSAFVARSTLVYLYMYVNIDLLICIFFFFFFLLEHVAPRIFSLLFVVNLHTCATRDLVSTRVPVLVLAWIILFWGEVVLFWAL